MKIKVKVTRLVEVINYYRPIIIDLNDFDLNVDEFEDVDDLHDYLDSNCDSLMYKDTKTSLREHLTSMANNDNLDIMEGMIDEDSVPIDIEGIEDI